MYFRVVLEWRRVISRYALNFVDFDFLFDCFVTEIFLFLTPPGLLHPCLYFVASIYSTSTYVFTSWGLLGAIVI